MDAKAKADLLIKLLQNEKFLARFNDAEGDMSRAKALFASEGLELSDDQLQIVMQALDDAKKAMYSGELLPEDKLQNVAGGVEYNSAKNAIAASILAGTI